jgi:hypothetical protein
MSFTWKASCGQRFLVTNRTNFKEMGEGSSYMRKYPLIRFVGIRKTMSLLFSTRLTNFCQDVFDKGSYASCTTIHANTFSYKRDSAQCFLCCFFLLGLIINTSIL